MLTARLVRRTAPCLVVLLLAAAGCETSPDLTHQVKLNEQRFHDLDDRLVDLNSRLDSLADRIAEAQLSVKDFAAQLGQARMDIEKIRQLTPALGRWKTSQERQAHLAQLLQEYSTADDAGWILVKEKLIRMGHIAVGPLLQRYAAGEPLALRRVPEVLRELIDPQAITELAAGMENRRTRMIAAEAIGLLGNPAGIPYLRAHLADESPEVRHEVAVALGRLKDPGGLLVLASELDSAELTVRLIAISEIERLTGQDFGYSAYEKDDAKRTEAIDRLKAYVKSLAEDDAEKPDGDGEDPKKPGAADGEKPAAGGGKGAER